MNYRGVLATLTFNLVITAIAFVAIIVLFAILTGGTSLSPGNITNIILQYSYILILAIGMVIVIIAGHIDLSVGSVVALTGAVSAVLVIRNGMPWWVGILAALAVGIAVGAWHGFWVAYVGIPAFIVTLAGMLLFRGLTLQVLDNISLSPFPAEYGKVATGFLNGLIGGQGFDAFTLLIGAIAVGGYALSQWRTRVARIRYQQPVESFPLFVAKIVAVGAVVMYFAWQLAHARGLPIVLIILAVLIIVYGLVSKRTVFGRQIYAIGGNGYDAFTLLIGVIAVAGYAFSGFRTRLARIKYQQPVESFPLFVARVVAVGLVVMYFAWQLAHARGLPIVLIILAVLIIAYGVITNRSVFGRQVYAIGGNLSAATLSGVKVKTVNFWIFVNMGFLSAVAGIIYSSRSNGAQPAAGNMFELDAIAAAFIGGAAVTGGVGTVVGAMVGGLIMAVMSNGMQLMGVDQSIQSVVKGLVLLLAVAF
ncbi:MAG: hypothetical protein M3116_06385, partial [Actinomycetota bacterium]|nr:hypothetical protein [Actinomycetota bacterium]